MIVLFDLFLELNHLIQSRESQITMLENVRKTSEAQINKLQHDICTLQQTVIRLDTNS